MNTLEIIFSNEILCLFATIGLGLALGKVSVKGINLGAAGVLFVALIIGHYGFTLPEGTGKIGLVLFIYSIGISAGGRFFSAFAKEGGKPVILALVTMATGALCIWGYTSLSDIPTDLALGIYTGAMSSAPALAAASEGLEESQNLIVGFGIAYPIGIVGVILFTQLIPKLLYKNSIAEELEKSQTTKQFLLNILVEVTNPALFGKNISEFSLKHLHGCQIARTLDGEVLLPLVYEDTFLEGQHILIVGRKSDLEIAVELIGKRSERHYIRDTENERQHLQVHSKEFVGRSIDQIASLKNYGVMITRVSRYGFTFVPERDTVIENRDVLRVIGESDRVKEFSKAIGHNSAKDQSDLLPITLGISLGVFLGMIPFSLPGTAPITLGLAGGPLIVALILGHFGKVGNLIVYIPQKKRELLQNFGLVFFVADAGARGGASFVDTFQLYGATLFLIGLLVTTVSMAATILCAHFLYRNSPLSALGAFCGSMTSTPALGTLTSKYKSQIPVIHYATSYPIALIIITVVAKALIGFL